MLDVPVQACREGFQANPESHSILRSDEERIYSHKLVDPILPRKASSELLW